MWISLVLESRREEAVAYKGVGGRGDWVPETISISVTFMCRNYIVLEAEKSKGKVIGGRTGV